MDHSGPRVVPPAPAAPVLAAEAALVTDLPESFASAGAPPAGAALGRSILKNSAAQIIGRVLVALVRLLVAGIIIRAYGKDLFGEYSLIFGLLAIADWLVDFGTAEVFVREICRDRTRTRELLRILATSKLVQAPAAFVTLVAIFLALRYPEHVVIAGVVGGINLFFFAGVVVYRVIFRANLTTEREVAAELVSVVAMVPMVAFVCMERGSLTALLVAHVISRAIYFALCVAMGRKEFLPSFAGVKRMDIQWALRSSAVIGVVGFLVGGYETLDILLLSKLGGFSQLAYYSGAQRLVWPMLMVLASVAGTFYPVLSGLWPGDRPRFEATVQRAVDTILLLAGVALASLLAGAGFYMGLLGEELRAGAPVLRVLAVLCFVKAFTSTIGPVLYVVKAQNRALQFVAVVLMIKIGVLAILTPRFGYMGVAYGALAVETLFAAIPALFLVQHTTGYRIKWNIPVKVALCIALAAFIAHWTFGDGMMAAAVAPLVFTAGVFAVRAVHLSELQLLLARKGA